MYDKKEVEKNIKELLQDDESESSSSPFIILLCITCVFTLFQTAILGAFLIHLR